MHLYSTQFQAKKRRPDESWADFADGLKLLADRALPELQEEAQEKLSLDHFLWEMTKQQVVFAVRQRRPKTLDDAVAIEYFVTAVLVTIGVRTSSRGLLLCL